MPVYEYKCQKCSKIFEITHKITDKPIKKCPSCHGVVDRLISSTAFNLKGSGWYKDLYGTPPPPKREEKKEEKKEKTSDGGSSGKA